MTHELSWPAANLRRCGWPHSPPFRHTLHFPDGVRLTPEQAEPRASREVHESTPLDSGIQAGLSDKVVAMIIMHYLSAYGPATPQQFAQWIDAPPSWAAEQFELHSRRLTKINFNERIGEILEGKPPAQRRDRHGRRHA